MAQEPETLETEHDDLQRVWTEIGVEGSDTRLKSDGTIVPAGGADEALARAIKQKLPRLAIAGHAGGPVDLAMGKVLGQGGVGVVRIARQVPVDREVAVKAVKPGTGKANAHTELLREAWITGRLEHPSIVPIYNVGRDQHDLPVMVMKRIEGVPWQDVIRDPEHEFIKRGGRSPLPWHLGKLVQVCNAIAFAHSRGILHRDLKPENVMIGAFGEVYVLDWGIAVSLRDDPHLPLAKDVVTIAGTPDYMAPEQTTGDGSLLCVETDIYQLGAILHEIITGEPRHTGATVFEKIMAASRSSEYDYDSSIPEELAAIANRAMAFHPADRYESVDEFHSAITGFLSHMNSVALAKEAHGRLEAMMYLVGSEGDFEAEDITQLNNLFGECRFGFKQALKTWSGNTHAREGLQEALELMAEFELDRGAHESAGAIIADLPERRPLLELRLDELQKRAAEEESVIRKIKAVERKRGSRDGSGWSAAILGIVIACWGIAHLIASLLTGMGAYDVEPWNYLAAGGGTLAVVGAWTAIFRRSVFKSPRSRRVLATSAVLAGALFIVWVAAYWQGTGKKLDPQYMTDLLVTLAILSAAAVFERRLRAAAWSFLAGYALALYRADWAAVCYVVAAVAAVLGTVIQWRPRFDEERLKLGYDHDHLVR